MAGSAMSLLFGVHDPAPVALAILICLSGSLILARLWQKAAAAEGRGVWDWLFLSAVTGGATVWATHFLAMIAFHAVPGTRLQPALTMASGIVAMLGLGCGLAAGLIPRAGLAVPAGGLLLGLGIGAMHYLGMAGFSPEGGYDWHRPVIVLSVAAGCVLSAVAVALLRFGDQGRLRNRLSIAGAFTCAVLLLHFTAMAALDVDRSVHAILPLAGNAPVEGRDALVGGVTIVTLLILAIGLAVHVIDRRSAEQSANQLSRIALYDALTAIPNRRMASDCLVRRFDTLDGGGPPFAYLMLDLDRFKQANDLHGHPVGDEVLRRCVGRIAPALRSGDLLARIGGDEFCIITEAGTDCLARAGQLGEIVTDLLSRPFLIEGRLVEIGVSVGIAVAGPEAPDPAILVRNADIALYTAKQAGRGEVRVFAPDMAAEFERRHRLEADLRRALAREEFELFFQPLRDTATGRFAGAEALIRWNHPEKGMIPPGEFIPLAEELGLIGQIGAWVIATACREAAGWPEDLKIAVNLSPLQLRDRRLVDQVRGVLEATGLRPARLELEITETAILGNDQLAHDILTELRGIGVKISFDDFGTGYSSLSFLHRFPLDRIKIDRSFVQSVGTSDKSAALVQAIAQLGGVLGVAVTAEGVETDGQAAFASRFGCDQLQGWLIGRPVDAAEATALFAAAAAAEALPAERRA